jgi:hypothetical protein
MKFANSELEMELLNGEYRRYIDENGTMSARYVCVGILGDNRMLFQYIDTVQEPVDFIQSVISNIPDPALDYLVDVLSENSNVMVMLMFVPGSATGYDIYYDCTCASNDVNSLEQWVMTNNDFAAFEYKYTEITNGHQRCAGTEE